MRLALKRPSLVILSVTVTVGLIQNSGVVRTSHANTSNMQYANFKAFAGERFAASKSYQ